MTARISEYDITKIKNNIISGYYEGIIFKSGLIYQGGLYNGKFDGEGRIILPCGDVYSYTFSEAWINDGRRIIISWIRDGNWEIGCFSLI